jgi:hypothetical protein
MTINKVLNKLEINRDGIVFAEYITEVMDDAGILIASGTPHRETFTPDTNITTIITDSPNIKAVATTLWTPAVVSNYKTKIQTANDNVAKNVAII